MEKPDPTFEELITQHQQMIRKICTIYCHNEDEKDDLFQEITIQLWKSFSSFERRSKFSTWLYRVAINTAVTLKRKANRIPISVSLSEREMCLTEAEENEREEDLNRLKRAIRHLNKTDRAIIFLYLEEKSYREISEIIGITPKHVGVKIVRIKAKLLTLMTKRHGK